MNALPSLPTLCPFSALRRLVSFHFSGLFFPLFLASLNLALMSVAIPSVCHFAISKFQLVGPKVSGATSMSSIKTVSTENRCTENAEFARKMAAFDSVQRTPLYEHFYGNW